MEDDDSSYEDIKAALLGSSAMAFSAAAESFFTADKGTIQQLPIRQMGDKLVRYCEKMTEVAETVRQAVDKVTVGMLRVLMVPELKNYMDLTKSTDRQEYQRLAEQWEKSQPYRRSMFKQTSGYRSNYQYRDNTKGEHTLGSQQFPITCFACRKIGHVSKKCSSRLLETHRQESTNVTPKDTRPLSVFLVKGWGTSHHSAPRGPRIR